jgi:hypothetical protein
VDDDEGFAAGRQAILDALASVEQRAHERAESALRQAQERARQLTAEAEAHARQVTADAEAHARQMVAEAEQRARLVTGEAGQRVAELEQQLAEVRDNLEAARTQLEEQFVASRGLVEVARANLATVRERAAGAARLAGVEPRTAGARIGIPPLSGSLSGSLSTPREPVAADTAELAPLSARERAARPAEQPRALTELRAAVDALKRPRRGESIGEAGDLPPEEEEAPREAEPGGGERPGDARGAAS